MTTADYGYHRTLPGASLADARERMTKAMAAEGFGILTEIDLSATLAKKLDVEVSPYVILGACNPTLAYKAVQVDPNVGLLLPCNVILRHVAHGVEVGVASPRAMFSIVGSHALEAVVEDADARVRRAIDAA